MGNSPGFRPLFVNSIIYFISEVLFIEFMFFKNKLLRIFFCFSVSISFFCWMLDTVSLSCTAELDFFFKTMMSLFWPIVNLLEEQFFLESCC